MIWYFELFDIVFKIDILQLVLLTAAFWIVFLLGYVLGHDNGKKVTDEAWRIYYMTGRLDKDSQDD